MDLASSNYWASSELKNSTSCTVQVYLASSLRMNAYLSEKGEEQSRRNAEIETNNKQIETCLMLRMLSFFQVNINTSCLTNSSEVAAIETAAGGRTSITAISHLSPPPSTASNGVKNEAALSKSVTTDETPLLHHLEPKSNTSVNRAEIDTAEI